jgi:hypothetical protein
MYRLKEITPGATGGIYPRWGYTFESLSEVLDFLSSAGSNDVDITKLTTSRGYDYILNVASGDGKYSGCSFALDWEEEEEDEEEDYYEESSEDEEVELTKEEVEELDKHFRASCDNNDFELSEYSC